MRKVTATDLGFPLRASDLRAAVNLLGQSTLPLARGRARRGVLALMGIGEALPAMGAGALDQFVRLVGLCAEDPEFAAQLEGISMRLNPPEGAGKAILSVLHQVLAAAPQVAQGDAPIRFVGSAFDDGWAKDYYAVGGGVDGPVSGLLVSDARMELAIGDADDAPRFEVATPAARAGVFASAPPIVSVLRAEPYDDLRILVQQRVRMPDVPVPLDVGQGNAKAEKRRRARGGARNLKVIRGGQGRPDPGGDRPTPPRTKRPKAGPTKENA
jgi:hypothetical protein